MLSPEVQKFFPYAKVRKEQEQLIVDIERTLQDKKVLLAHAPTGLGKTVSALSAALAVALHEKKVVFFLTNRHTQHRIAVETLKEIKKKSGEKFTVVDLIGKRWMCSQSVAALFGADFMDYCRHVVEKGECEFYNNVKDKKALKVEAKRLIIELEEKGPFHTEELIDHCKEEKMCSYEISLAMAKAATLLIGDYNYLFNPYVQSTILNKMEKELGDVIVVVDEAHNLPDRVSEMMSSSLSSFVLKNAIIEAKKFYYDSLIQWLQDLMSVLQQLADFQESNEMYKRGSKEKKLAKLDFLANLKKFVDYDEFVNQLELAAEEVREKQQRSFLGSIVAFLNAWQGDDEGYVRFITEKETRYGPVVTLYYACLDPRVLTKDIFHQIHSGVLMSGTLKPTFMYKDILGIERAVEKEYGSPFPVENKLTLVIPETSTKFSLRGEAMYKLIAQRCTILLTAIPGNVAFFFPSYDLRDNVGRYIISDKPLFWEKTDLSKEEKGIFFEQFKAVKNHGGVLLGVNGANFAEGVDFPGDLLQGVVVVGLPLAKPDLKTREIINYYDHRFEKGWDYGYVYPALNKCFQSAGRCIRSEKDRGVVVYLDERFVWQQYFCCFPKEGLIVTKEYEKYLNAFFEKEA